MVEEVVWRTGADRRRRTLGGELGLTGAIVCVITKSAILISAQFIIAALFVHGPKSIHRVARYVLVFCEALKQYCRLS